MNPSIQLNHNILSVSSPLTISKQSTSTQFRKISFKKPNETKQQFTYSTSLILFAKGVIMRCQVVQMSSK